MKAPSNALRAGPTMAPLHAAPRFPALAALLLLGLAAAACSDDAPSTPQTDTGADLGADTDLGGDVAPDASPDAAPDAPLGNDILALAEAAGDFTTLLAAIDAAGLRDELSGDGPFTVFAPTDAAFVALLEALDVTAEALLASPDLAAILLYHTVEGELDAATVTATSLHRTMNGAFILVRTGEGGAVSINDAAVAQADIQADNGIIHVIDGVLLPPDDLVTTVVESEDFTILEQVVTTMGTAATDLLGGAGPLTVFAPTDDAFVALATALDLEVSELLALPNLADILLYHVVDAGAAAADVVGLDRVETVQGLYLYIDVADSGVILNNTMGGGVNVTTTDVLAANGIVHLVDAVLLPPTLAEVAELEGYSLAVMALAAADLVDALADPSAELTAFLPTDAAIAALLAELDITPEELLASPDLPGLLLYHVSQGANFAADVVGLELIDSLLLQEPTSAPAYASPLAIRVDGDGVFVNNARIIATDLEASNGVIHGIDAVMWPLDVVAIAGSNDDFESLTAAIVQAGLVEALAAPNGPFTVLAPTDDAFAALLVDLGVSSLGEIDDGTLAAVLKLHVLHGFFPASEVVAASTLDTLAGDDTLTVAVDGSTVTISNGDGSVEATVVQTNISSANALVHVIDTVLTPPSE
jgi:transforming growth factor-beta-induced protein